MEIRTFIGRKLNYVNGILRRQIELDRYLKDKKDIRLTYSFYEGPKNILDFISKRYILYPIYSRKQDKETRYFIDLDLISGEIINRNFDQRNILVNEKVDIPGFHRVYISKGQYNKLVEKHAKLKK